MSYEVINTYKFTTVPNEVYEVANADSVVTTPNEVYMELGAVTGSSLGWLEVVRMKTELYSTCSV